MCWNCGCMKPDDDHGNAENITTDTLKRAMKAGGPETLDNLMNNMNEIYDAKIKGQPVATQRV